MCGIHTVFVDFVSAEGMGIWGRKRKFHPKISDINPQKFFSDHCKSLVKYNPDLTSKVKVIRKIIDIVFSFHYGLPKIRHYWIDFQIPVMLKLTSQ